MTELKKEDRMSMQRKNRGYRRKYGDQRSKENKRLIYDATWAETEWLVDGIDWDLMLVLSFEVRLGFQAAEHHVREFMAMAHRRLKRPIRWVCVLEQEIHHDRPHAHLLIADVKEHEMAPLVAEWPGWSGLQAAKETIGSTVYSLKRAATEFGRIFYSAAMERFLRNRPKPDDE